MRARTGRPPACAERHVTSVPDPLCDHGAPIRRTGKGLAACSACGSFWDLDALGAGAAYDGDYPEQRAHHDAEVGRLKVASLAAWLDDLGIAVEGKNVCEVGFGGGHCLGYLRDRAARVFGIEAVPENLAHARRLGLAASDVFAADALPERLPAPVDLWLFLDSFEHLEEPGRLLDWLTENAAPDARVLLVAPEAGSPSQRWLGRFWPHQLRDHPFHWSRAGLVEFFERRGLAVEATFAPTKSVSLRTLVFHGVHKLRLESRWRASWTAALPSWSLRFNIGEMGLLFRRAPAS